ncbi:hypothetical protein R6Q57_023500 [Mikania cordata]
MAAHEQSHLWKTLFVEMRNEVMSSIDKSWITNPNRRSDEYQQGLVLLSRCARNMLKQRLH